MMAGLAVKYQRGRFILIGTTDLDLVYLVQLGALVVLGFDPAMGLEAFRLTFR